MKYLHESILIAVSLIA